MSDRTLPPDDDLQMESAYGQIDDSSTPIKKIGDFDILSELGRGGMGVVYEARQISLNRRVALKVLPPGLGLTETAVKRFEREARAAAKLHHTNIVPVFAIGEEEGCHYYAMELVEGQPLSDVLRDMTGEGSNPLLDGTASQSEPTTNQEESGITSLSDSQSGGRKWFDAVARLIAEVADALDYAHGRGVIHRDIKPANLMLSREGKLCVTDFGLARVAQEPGMTVSGSLLGTPAYMSPEQVAVGRMKLDHRTDIYSLGAVLYELLTHTRPFPGESREEILGGILTKDSKPPRRLNPRIPIDLETICQKAMEKDPDRRYHSAGEFASDLRQYLQRGLITARRANVAQRAWKSIRRHPTIATAVALTIVAALALTAVLWIAGERSTTAEVERLLLEGQIALEAGRYREGMDTVDQVLSIDPQSDQARILKAKFLTYAGNRRLVMDEAQDQLERDPDDWVSHMIVAFAALEWLDVDYTIDLRKHVKALENVPESADLFYLRAMVADSAQEQLRLLDRALELEPNHHHALEKRLGLLIWTFTDIDGALRLCERIIVARPKSELGFTLKAFALAQLRDYEGVMETLERAVEVDPGEAHVYWTRAVLRNGFGEYREAIQDYTRAIELRPHNSRQYKHRGETYVLLKEYEKAIADARSAIEINPNYPGNWELLITGLIEVRDEVELRVAIQEFSERVGLLKDAGASSWGFNQLSRAHRELGDYEQAVSDAERAIEFDPNGVEGYQNRLRARRHLGIEDAVSEDCDRLDAIEIEPVYEDLTRANALAVDCSRPEQALGAYTRIIDRLPEYWRAYRFRGNLHAQLKQYEEALDDYEKAVQLAPNSPSALNAYAWALLTSEPSELLDPEKALALALRANETTGFANVSYLDTLAQAYHLTGDTEKAIETQRNVIAALDDRADRSESEQRLAEYEAALGGGQ